MPFFDATVSVALLIISIREGKWVRWSTVSDKASRYRAFPVLRHHLGCSSVNLTDLLFYQLIFVGCGLNAGVDVIPWAECAEPCF